MEVKGRAFNANGDSGISIAVIIHKPIAKEIGLEAGNSIRMSTNNGKIVIEKAN